MNAKLLQMVVCVLLLGVAIAVIGQGKQTGVLMSQQELRQRMQDRHDILLIDVRTADEFGMGHVPGAINIPYTELAERLGEVRPTYEKSVVVYCESGQRAGIAEGILRQAGLDNIRHLEGDMAAWRDAGLPIEK